MLRCSVLGGVSNVKVEMNKASQADCLGRQKQSEVNLLFFERNFLDTM